MPTISPTISATMAVVMATIAPASETEMKKSRETVGRVNNMLPKKALFRGR